MSAPTINISNLAITNLDFVNIRQSLVDFLKQQSEFTDYNFDGSGMAVILDLLAYNAWFDSFMANAVANETYLSTAKRRDTVVQIAKQLGYTPKSVQPAVASINICIVVPNSYIGTPPSTITMPMNFEFSGTGDDGTSYIFYTTDNNLLTLDATIGTKGAYVNAGGSITIREGTSQSFVYIFDGTGQSDPVILPNVGVDTQSFVVEEMTDTTSNTVLNTYVLADDINAIDNTSLVFWFEEVPGMKYRIYFGDNVIGKSPAQNAVIRVRYKTCNGKLANGIGRQNVLAFNNGVGVFTGVPAGAVVTPSVVVNNGEITGYASGGDDIESIDSIKFNAPKNYQAQNRCVTAGDYSRVITSNANFTIESINVYGGEDLSPPQLGKVFVSIKPAGAETMNGGQQTDVNRIISDKSVLGIEAVFVDSMYVYLKLVVDAYYENVNSSVDPTTIDTEIRSVITDYSSNNLQKFGHIFKYSNLLDNIAEADESITRALLFSTMYVKKTFNSASGNIITNNTNSTIYSFYLNNKIYHPDSSYRSVTSTTFSYLGNTGCTLADNGSGVLQILKSDGSVFDANIGTVDYTTGTIVLGILTSLFIPDSIDNGNVLKIYADVDNDGVNDVYTKNEQILAVESDEVYVTVSRDSYN